MPGCNYRLPATCRRRFPGGPATYDCVCEVCDADLLADAMLHCATTPACANQAFNISNGDTFRWRDVGAD